MTDPFTLLYVGGLSGAVAHVGPTVAIAAYGRGFVACTGCADPLNGGWMERHFPQMVAEQRVLQCVASGISQLVRYASNQSRH